MCDQTQSAYGHGAIYSFPVVNRILVCWCWGNPRGSDTVALESAVLLGGGGTARGIAAPRAAGGAADSTSNAAGHTTNGSTEALSGLADGAAEALGGLADGTAEALGGLADSAAEALGGLVQAVAQALGGAAQGAGDASEEAALALGLVAAGEDVVNTAENTAQETAAVGHFDGRGWVGLLVKWVGSGGNGG